MPRWSALSTALLATAIALPATANEQNVLAPYRFSPPTRLATPLEQQKALSYRSQVQNQLRTLDLQESRRGGLDSDARRLRLETRDELGRVNGVLGR